MSGGEKLNARQKMIGMMYLVLTAMLALQVSSSVLDKFVLINRSLEKSIQKQEEENSVRLERIKKIVSETGGRTKDMEVLTLALNVRKETNKVLGYIEGLKNEMIEKSGGKDAKTGRPKSVKDDAVVAQIMINASKADDLKKLLNGYMEYLTKVSGKDYKPIALDAKDSELFKHDPNQHDKDFAILNFEKTPLGAALATLSQFGTEITYAESDIFEMLSHKLGADDVKFDKIFPLVRPQSNIVAAGATYEADLFLGASASAVEPEMSIDSKKIPVQAGVGKIVFPVTAGTYDQNGLAKKIFKAAIRLKVPGGDSTIYTDVEYFVAKPVIQVQSASVAALYLNAGNELNIQVPALGVNYKPKFTAQGASIIIGQGKGLVTIIPNAAEVKLSVYNNDTFLDVINFKVRPIPKPTIKITAGGKPIDERMGVPAPGPRKLEVKAVPEEGFLSFLPKDARYRVAEWEVTLARGSRPLQTKKIVQKQEVSLSEFASQAQTGDRVVVEIKKVERLNYKDEIEPVNLGSVVYNIPIS
jgi:gliding motility-associated protein GldM